MKIYCREPPAKGLRKFDLRHEGALGSKYCWTFAKLNHMTQNLPKFWFLNEPASYVCRFTMGVPPSRGSRTLTYTSLMWLMFKDVL